MKKLIYLIVVIVALGLIVSGCISVVPPTEQGNIDNLTKATLNILPGVGTIQAAINVANPDDTIILATGTYNEGIITIDKNLTIIGATSKPIINPTTDTGIANTIGPTGRGWFQIHNGAVVTFKNLVFNGTGNNIYTAVHYHVDSAGGTVENCDFMNIQYSQYWGRGINNYGQYVEVIDCTFENIQRIGVFTFNPSAETLIEGCTYIGKGIGDYLDYAFEAGNGGFVTIANCDVSNCLGVASVDGSISAGILVTTYFGPGTNAMITGCNIINCTDGIAAGYGADDTSTVTANYNNITGNTYGIYNTSSTQIVDATRNWWGHASGPGGEGGRINPAGIIIGRGDAVSINVNWNPWLPKPVGLGR